MRARLTPSLGYAWPLLLLLLPSFDSQAPAEAATFSITVSPHGSDSNPGTETKPVATLAAARDAIRRLRRSGGLRGPAEVVVRRGVYTTPPSGVPVLALTAEDSGTAEMPITYRAYPGEDVVLSAGVQVARKGTNPCPQHALE